MTALGFERALTVLNHTLENNGGTFDHNGMPYVGKEGYALSLNPELGKVVDLEDVTGTTVTAYFHDFADPDKCVGTWVHNGQVHFDVVTVVDDFDHAMHLAAMAEQLAVYDLVNGEELFVSEYDFATEFDDDFPEYLEWQDLPWGGDDQYSEDLWDVT